MRVSFLPRPVVSAWPAEESLQDADFERFRQLIESETGIHLSDAKRGLLVARLSRRVRALGMTSLGNYFELEPIAFLVTVKSPEGFAAAERDGLLVALNKNLTPELIAEGRVRELVRHIQEARKNAGLEVTDRIRLYIDAPAELSAALDAP
ncbi:MAG TPA: DUF5915 domain-containing protein [Thermoanaerobaculia bacterium]|nr:DUF5915 domain-containing protein [Thermoanaerobaculia bacterium]